MVVISGLKIIPAFIVLAATAAYAADTPADVKAGAILFRDKGCTYCHGPAGEGTKKAPPLADLRDGKTWPTEKIADQILNGGKKMPPFRDALSDEEIQQLIAYLRAKDRPAPPPADPGATPPSQ
jgi:mono/diheme cytochrome c family protein